MKTKLIALVFAILATGHAWADTIETRADAVIKGWILAGQTFFVPEDDIILSYQFNLAPRESDGVLNFSIWKWSGTSPIGSAVYSTDVQWTQSGGWETVSGINTQLKTGDNYAAILDFKGYKGDSVVYMPSTYLDGYFVGIPGGNGQDGFSVYPEYDMLFRAQFGEGQENAPTPEPSTFLLLGVGFGGLALLRKKVRSK